MTWYTHSYWSEFDTVCVCVVLKYWSLCVFVTCDDVFDGIYDTKNSVQTSKCNWNHYTA